MLVSNISKLKDLALRKHYSCEDSWYSCPKSEDGCAQDNDGECICGAEDHNAKVLLVFARAMTELDSNIEDNRLRDWEIDYLRDRDTLLTSTYYRELKND